LLVTIKTLSLISLKKNESIGLAATGTDFLRKLILDFVALVCFGRVVGCIARQVNVYVELGAKTD